MEQESFIKRFINRSPTLAFLIIAILAGCLIGLILDTASGHASGVATYNEAKEALAEADSTVQDSQIVKLTIDWGWKSWLFMSNEPSQVWKQPWGIFTYAFITPVERFFFFSILLNLLFIYQFGRILKSMIGEKKLRDFVLFFIPFNALLIFLLLNLLNLIDPARHSPVNAWTFGTTGLATAIIAAAITTAPNYPIRLIIFGQLKLVLVGGILIFLKFASGASWKFAHEMLSVVIGLSAGFAYVKLMRKGTNVPEIVMDWFRDLFSAEKFKKRHQNRPEPVFSGNSKRSREAEMNRLLDKISEKGYDSLTKEEKEFLANFED